MNEDRLWFLLARHLSDEASAAESEELKDLLHKLPEQQYLADIISNYFKSSVSEAAAQPGRSGLPGQLERIMQESDKDSFSAAANNSGLLTKAFYFRPIRLISYAAAVVGLSLTVWLVYRSTPSSKRSPEIPVNRTSEVISRPGARTKLVLPDGSQVWLNSGSTLHYRNDFNNHSREVDLEGEGFFDVVRNADHPFIVHTSAINVKVLGTAFNVKSYSRDRMIETTLLRGMVEVTRKDDPNAPKVILRPNEKLIFSKIRIPEHPAAAMHENQATEQQPDISIISVPRNIPDSDKVETSWMYNKLVFDGDSFPELAVKMERWYNTKIVFKSERLLKYRFKGVFSNESVSEALDALRLTARFSYKVKENEIDLYNE